MKSVMKKSNRLVALFFILAAGIMSAICLGACGWRNEKAGSYYFDSMLIESDGVMKEYKLGDTLPWGVVATKDVRIIRLTSNGGALLRLQEDRDEVTGTWETVEGEPNKIIITIDGESMPCECDGSTLVVYYTDGSRIMTFKK